VTNKLLLFLLATAAALAESPFGFGLKAGVPLNDALSTTPGGAIHYFQSTHRYTIGPYAEFRLPSGFSVELDALYRSYSFRQALSAAPNVSTGAWEFPLLAKKSLFGGPVQPYIEGGVCAEPPVGERCPRTQPPQQLRNCVGSRTFAPPGSKH
jgi:hypothetical protein